MSLRTIFNNLTAGNQSLSLLDQQFADFGNWVVIPCTASGTNNISLTPMPLTSSLPSYGFMNLFAFIGSGNSTGPVFAAFDGLPSLPVYSFDGVTQIGSGGVRINFPYFLQYSPSLNNGNGGFYLLPVGGSLTSFPTAAVIVYASSPPPAGFLACNGQAVSRATYSALFAIIGTSYGAGDGSTTFNVPDQGRTPGIPFGTYVIKT
jgi:hypothetical protein